MSVLYVVVPLMAIVLLGVMFLLAALAIFAWFGDAEEQPSEASSQDRAGAFWPNANIQLSGLTPVDRPVLKDKH
jgi:flagellar basal body-associated protein FliL